MKRLVLIFSIVFSIGCAMAQTSASVWKSYFFVGLNGHTSLNRDTGWCHPYGFGMDGGYQWYLVKGLYFQPSVSLYFEKRIYQWTRFIGEAPVPHCNYTEFGYGLNGIFGYSIPVASSNSLSFFTGYRYAYAFHKKEKANGVDEKYFYCVKDRIQMYWSLGVQFNLLKHYYVFGSVDFALKNFSNEDRKNEPVHMLSFGLGYKF